MDIRNDTTLETGFTLGPGPEGKPCVSVIVKGTFTIPTQTGATATLAEEQLPLWEEDHHFDGDASASVKFEADTVPYKPAADIVLVGHGYAPGGRPTTQVDVLLRVGSHKQMLRLIGDRQWNFPSRMLMKPLISDPKPFTQMPLRYERAFGGFDRVGAGCCEANPLGQGFITSKARDAVHEKLLPNIEDPREPITAWNDHPRPVGFGFYGKTFAPRRALRGTEAGLADPDPLLGLPSDFEPGFFNGAHPDLQVPGYLQGNEEVELFNLTPDGPRAFRLPGITPDVRLALHEEGAATAEEAAPHVLHGVLDTLVLLPDEGRGYVVWRFRHPLPERYEDVVDVAYATVRLSV